MVVWVIESGEYEQRNVYGVAASPERAVEFVKAMHEPPYVVEWSELEDTSWTHGGVTHARYELVGRFEAVPNKSTQHVGSYSISAYDLN